MLERAGRVFSTGLVDILKSRGHDFFEIDCEGSYLFDASGNRYLDCFTSGATYNLGRKNPELMHALREASREIDQGVFLMISEQKARLAEKLSKFVPGTLDCSLFQVVRGEAFDAACKLSRGYTARPGLVSVNGGWYGETGFAVNLSQRENLDLFGSPMPETYTIPFGDISALDRAVGRKTAAVILETVQAENHCRSVDKEYLKAVRTICDRKGALLLIDETQTGFGRTGSRFSFEQFDIQPDILVLGEAMSGGVFPMSCIVFTPEVKKFFDDHPLIHLNTFGGHDVGCLVAIRALEIYEKQMPWENAEKRGQQLLAGISAIAQKFSGIIQSVAGRGLLVSIRLQNPEMALSFCAKAKEQGVIVMPGKVDGSSIVLRPSLLVTKEEVDGIINSISKTTEMI